MSFLGEDREPFNSFENFMEYFIVVFYRHRSVVLSVVDAEAAVIHVADITSFPAGAWSQTALLMNNFNNQARVLSITSSRPTLLNNLGSIVSDKPALLSTHRTLLSLHVDLVLVLETTFVHPTQASWLIFSANPLHHIPVQTSQEISGGGFLGKITRMGKRDEG